MEEKISPDIEIKNKKRAILFNTTLWMENDLARKYLKTTKLSL